MSMERRRHEAIRRLTTAEEDLKAAEILRDSGMCPHSCFIAQQCAGKAIKALWHFIDGEPWGHRIQKLIRGLPDDARPQFHDDIVEMAAALDRFHIPARHPNGLPDLAPGAAFHLKDALVACGHAAGVLQSVRASICP